MYCVHHCRLGGEKVAINQSLFVANMLESFPQHTPSPSLSLLCLGSLFNRLLKLLSVPSQIHLLSACASPSSWLWSHLTIHSLQRDVLSSLLPQWTADAVQLLVEGAGHSYHHVVSEYEVGRFGCFLGCRALLCTACVVFVTKKQR